MYISNWRICYSSIWSIFQISSIIGGCVNNKEMFINNVKGESKKKGLALRLNYVMPDEFCALTY